MTSPLLFSAFPVTLLAPLVLLAMAGLCLSRPGRRPGRLPALAEAATLAAAGLGFAGMAQLWVSGKATLYIGGLPLFRLDTISLTMVLLVAFVGWVVVRYARRYLDGEAREGMFHALTLAGIAVVLLLVQAANLAILAAAFVAIGIVLRHRPHPRLG